MPFYEYDEARFFRSDGAPAEVAAAPPRRLHAAGGAVRRSASPRPRALTAEVRAGISDLQFTGRLPRAVPVQPLRARAPARRARSCESSSGVTVTDLDGNALLRPDRLLRRQRLRLRLLQGVHRRGQRARARPRPGARRLPPGGRRQRAAPARDLGPGRGVVPHVGHRGGDAGGAAGALPHAAHAPGALLRRLPRLVGRRAAGRRQPARRRARPTRCKDMDEDALRVLRTRERHRLRAGQPAAGAAPERQRARRLARWSTAAARRALRPRRLHRLAASSCARSAPSAASC